MSRKIGLFFGILFGLAYALSFSQNSFIGSHGALFYTDKGHDLLHLFTALLFIFLAFVAPDSIAITLKGSGTGYIALGILGLLTLGTNGIGIVFNFIGVNGADTILNLVVGFVLIGAGMVAAMDEYIHHHHS